MTSLHIPQRTIPTPTSISPEAQAVLEMGPLGSEATHPELDDVAGWKAWVAAQDAIVVSVLASQAVAVDAEHERREIDGVVVHVVKPSGCDEGRIVLDIHGGALMLMGGDACELLARVAAPRFGLSVWSPDYRMPPDHPYPAALDDCMRTYRALLDDRPAGRIVLSGGSAGGNLAAALLLRARDEGLSMPAALVLATPEVDLTESGDSFRTNLGVDTILSSLLPINTLYASGHDLADPHLSPLFGDLTGFPPTILTTGTRDLFLSNTVRMHRALRRAGVEAELHVQEAAPHGGFLGAAPEDIEIAAEVRRFIEVHCAPSFV